jgi:hypothetical protein
VTQTFGQNASGDIYLGPDGNLVVLSGINAVAAACRTATLAQLGEMVLATTQGIPNFSAIWTGTPEYNIWKSYILSTLQNVNGVQAVNSLTLSVDGNTISYTANITTIYGSTTVNG